MRIAHIADVHLDQPFTGLGEAEGERARRGLISGFRRALGIAVERGVDLVTIGGDLWEGDSVRVDTRRAVARALGELEIPVLMICGNHDPWVPGGEHARTAWPSNVTVVEVNQPVERVVAGVGVWAASWVGSEMSADFLREIELPRGRRHLLLIHGTARAAGFFAEEETYCPFDPAAVTAAGFDLCLAGHIHRGGVSGPVVYPGPPEPLGRGEDGTHSVAIVEVPEQGEISVELVPTNTQSYRRLVVDCSGAGSSADLEAKLRAEIGEPDGTVHLRAELRGEVDRFCVVDKAALAESCGGGFAELRVVGEPVPDFDIERIAGQQTADGIFVRRIQQLLEEAGDDEGRRAELQEGMYVGLRALAGRKEVINVD